MKCIFLAAALALAQPALAETDVARVVNTARSVFPELPPVRFVEDIEDICGGSFDGQGAYCPSERQIFVAADLPLSPKGPYILAHLYGHAMQVTFGVADVALAAIQAERSREAELRGMVTRQVECLAGVLLSNAGLERPDLAVLFEGEPMTGSHWGRNPVREGPSVSIGAPARQEWLSRGFAAGHPDACSVGEMDVSLIAQRYQPGVD